jgi:hypothetical protein
MRDDRPKAKRAVVVSALRLEDGESSPVVFEWYIKSRPVEFYQALVMLVCKDGAHLSNGMQWLNALSPGVFRVRDSARSLRTRVAALAHNHLKEPPSTLSDLLLGPLLQACSTATTTPSPEAVHQILQLLGRGQLPPDPAWWDITLTPSEMVRLVAEPLLQRFGQDLKGKNGLRLKSSDIRL